MRLPPTPCRVCFRPCVFNSLTFLAKINHFRQNGREIMYCVRPTFTGAIGDRIEGWRYCTVYAMCVRSYRERGSRQLGPRVPRPRDAHARGRARAARHTATTSSTKNITTVSSMSSRFLHTIDYTGRQADSVYHSSPCVHTAAAATVHRRAGRAAGGRPARTHTPHACSDAFQI